MARILFIQDFWFEFLGTMYLSSLLKLDGHQVDLLIVSGEKDLRRSVQELKPDLVGLYCTTGGHLEVVETARKAKEWTGALTLLGGPHPTYFPEVVQEDGVDLVCRGEGEVPLRELARRLDQGQDLQGIPNLWRSGPDGPVGEPLAPLVQDLDSLPMPDRDLYYQRYPLLRLNPSKHVITGRGCPYRCSFCCNEAYNELYAHRGCMVRRRSPERVVEEILDLRERHGLGSVRFDDEVFLLRTEWLRRFLPLYQQKVNLPFTCLIRADLATNENVSLLARAGCYAAFFGVESAVTPLRNQVLGKKISLRQIRDTAALLHRYGIKVGTFNMLGIPGENWRDAWETVRLNRQLRVDFPWASLAQPYPGTRLLDRAREQGWVDPELPMEAFTQSYFNRSVVRSPDAARLTNLHKLFHLAVRRPWTGPLVRLLTRLPPNRIFDWIFSLTYGLRYMRTYRVPPGIFLRMAIKMRNRY